MLRFIMFFVVAADTDSYGFEFWVKTSVHARGNLRLSMLLNMYREVGYTREKGLPPNMRLVIEYKA